MIKKPALAVEAIGAGLLVCAGLLAVPGARAADKEDVARLDEANRRWAGARCRIRQPVTFKKGKDGEGWTKSAPLFWDPSGGNHRAYVMVSDVDGLLRAAGHRGIPVGTEFVASGWSEESPGGNLILSLGLAGTSVTVKVYYIDDWVGKVSLSYLPQFERWARFELFELLSVPSEQVVDVVEPEPPPAVPALPAPAAPRLTVLAASVEPARVRPAEEVRLVAVYSLEGVPPGRSAQITERRTILRSGESLRSVEAVAHRESGTHRSSLPVRLPADLAPGLYELRVSLETEGVAAEGTALFEVTPR